jgi:hypothetical protein
VHADDPQESRSDTVPPPPQSAASGTVMEERPGGFVHAAVCHRTTDELVAAVLPFVEEGLQLRERVYVNLAPHRIGAIQVELGPEADRVRWSDSRQWLPHPARRLRGLHELIDGEERHGGSRLRLVGECAFPSGPPEMVAEWERFDAVLNDALAGSPVTMLCTYDSASLAPDLIDRVPCSHPTLGVGPSDANPRYLAPDSYLLWHRIELAAAPESALRIGGEVTPADARTFVRQVLGGPHPLTSRGALDDVLVAVTEVVTNAWWVGATRLDLACWREGSEVGVQVDDDGPGVADPLAGYRRPPPGADRGRGLWIARQLVDLLEISSHPPQTSVRLRIFDPAEQAAA